MSQTPAAHGIHHVTALASDAQANLDFYVGALGLRMVKKSVNQDDPGTYHLFYADAAGTPGTDVTFFPTRGLVPGRKGTGQVVETTLAVPAGSLDGYWIERLAEHDVGMAEETTRFGERTLPFEDPDGLALALVEIEEDREFAPWEASGVPAEWQIRGVHAVRIPERELRPTVELLTAVMGFQPVAEDGGWRRYAAGEGSGAYAEIAEAPDRPEGRWGAGTVHHVAWRVKDDEEQAGLRAAVLQAGLRPTEPIDRFWFRSVYFREPGGTLFELATDGPGFDRDEPAAKLGETLVLPPWLEESRAEIEARLPVLEAPAGA